MPTSLLKIDLHLHTHASKDSLMRPDRLIKIAKRRGLDRICITDHNTLDGALAAKELDPDFVIVGEEIMTSTGGEILAFFVREWVPPHLSPQETIDRLIAQGAVISVAHPFDHHRHPWDQALLASLIAHLDAVETFNARTFEAKDNDKATKFAVAHNLAMTAGSDAHTVREVGIAYMEVPVFTTADEFRAGLREATIQGKLSPAWVHLFSTANKLRRRVRLKSKINK